MSEPAAPPAKRPIVVATLYTYCAMVIVLGLIALGVGVVMMAFADLFDMDEPEGWMIGGGITIFISGAIAVIHAVPFFLKRNDTSWRFIFGLLIAYIVVWGLTLFTMPLLAIPALLLSAWIKPKVKDYYGVVAPQQREYYGERRRGADWNDGWDEAWDRPRQ